MEHTFFSFRSPAWKSGSRKSCTHTSTHIRWVVVQMECHPREGAEDMACSKDYAGERLKTLSTHFWPIGREIEHFSSLEKSLAMTSRLLPWKAAALKQWGKNLYSDSAERTLDIEFYEWQNESPRRECKLVCDHRAISALTEIRNQIYLIDDPVVLFFSCYPDFYLMWIWWGRK